ncbi:MAG: hypothetical protein IIA85_02045 [Nanoarchaeota archaeon]|nr:hypothetical protein [Nanoarchaeota archaeon]
MNCNCRWCELILAVVILVFVIWPTQIFSAAVSGWIVVIAAVLLIVHSLFCNKCGGVCAGMMKGKKRK